MSGPDDIAQLKAMAAKARILARATTDRMTIDILENYAAECDDQIARLEALDVSAGPAR